MFKKKGEVLLAGGFRIRLRIRMIHKPLVLFSQVLRLVGGFCLLVGIVVESVV